MSPRLPPRDGFTVIELMIAIVVLSIGMLAMATMLASSSRLQRLAASRGEVTAHAEAKLEELRSYGQTEADNALRTRLALGGSLTNEVTAYADSVDGVNGVRYIRRWQITAGVAGARSVQVRVLPRTRPRDHVPRIDVVATVLLQ